MRNDLPSMSTGRAIAQASHAANAFIHKWGNRIDVKEWQRQTKQGFGTAIVLTSNIREIERAFIRVDNYLTKDWICDPDYVIPVSSEIIPFINKDCCNMFEVTDDETKYLFHRNVENLCLYFWF